MATFWGFYWISLCLNKIVHHKVTKLSTACDCNCSSSVPQCPSVLSIGTLVTCSIHISICLDILWEDNSSACLWYTDLRKDGFNPVLLLCALLAFPLSHASMRQKHLSVTAKQPPKLPLLNGSENQLKWFWEMSVGCFNIKSSSLAHL